MVCLDEAIELEFGVYSRTFLVILEVLFFFDFLLNFVTVPNQMNAPTFKKTAYLYLTTYFLMDFIATIVSNVLFLPSGYKAGLWAIRLKLFRIVRV